MTETTTGSSERLQMGKPVELVDALTDVPPDVYERFAAFRAQYGARSFTLLELREIENERLKQAGKYEYYCIISTGKGTEFVPNTFLRHTT